MTPTELENEILHTIPLTRAMALRVDAFDGHSLRLVAPLAPNVNDKGCAFGGSLASLLTLSCWGLARLALARAGQQADIYVQDSSISYFAPVFADLSAVASAAADDSIDAFLARFAQRGKARIAMVADVYEGTTLATRMSARFVAIRKPESAG
jgi:thioesterase domain-containing protein